MAGGADLIFPHHEAEIAQSQNYTGKTFVKHWMHVAMVYCGQKKMSKSLGNIIYIGDLLKKYSANTIRVLLLSHHYRKSWNFEYSELETAQKTAAKLSEALSKNSKQRPDLNPSEVKKSLPEFFYALDQDFNTPKAIAALIKATEGKISGKQAHAILAAATIIGLTPV